MSKGIAITGAGGFIGAELVNHFSSRGWKVKAFVRSQPAVKIQGVDYISYDLASPLNESDFSAIDFVVHAAYVRYDQRKDADELNVKGTKRLVELCRKLQLNLIFLSSFSAHENARSHYGRTKLACEQLFDLSKDLVLRPGLVIGKGGLASRMVSQIRNSGSMPLAGGSKPIQTIAVEELCSIIEKAITTGDLGLYHVAEAKAITLREFYEEIARQLNVKIRFIPVSLGLLLFGCRIAEMLRIKLPVTTENVLGLEQLIKFDTTGDLRALNVSVKNYKENIKTALK